MVTCKTSTSLRIGQFSASQLPSGRGTKNILVQCLHPSTHMPTVVCAAFFFFWLLLLWLLCVIGTSKSISWQCVHHKKMFTCWTVFAWKNNLSSRSGLPSRYQRGKFLGKVRFCYWWSVSTACANFVTHGEALAGWFRKMLRSARLGDQGDLRSQRPRQSSEFTMFTKSTCVEMQWQFFLHYTYCNWNTTSNHNRACATVGMQGQNCLQVLCYQAARICQTQACHKENYESDK